MRIHFSGEGETEGQPEDLLGPSCCIMLSYWLTYARKRKGLQPRFKRLVKARKKARK